jgi:hypothetical protein
MTGKGGRSFCIRGHDGYFAGWEGDVGVKGNEHVSSFPAIDAWADGLTSLVVKAGLLGCPSKWFFKSLFCSSLREPIT